MILKFIDPDPLLLPYVKIYNYIRITSQSEVMKFLPSGFPCLILNLGSSYTIHNKNYKNGQIEKNNLILGQQDHHYFLTPDKSFHIFLIVLQPTGFYRLFGQPFHEFQNNAVEVDRFDTDLSVLMKQLTDKHENLEDMVNLTNKFLLKKSGNFYSDYSFVEKSVEKIKITKGQISVRELSQYCNSSERTFRRRFLEATGISPKKYVQITRLHQIHKLANSNCKKNKWLDIVYKCGYYDQMHFIKEFKKFCGDTPDTFFSNNHLFPSLFTNLFLREL